MDPLERLEALREFHVLFNVDSKADERAIAIMGAAYLDGLLDDMLRSFLVDDEAEARRLLDGDRALGSFANRITAAYCLGLICPTVRDDLRRVARIRNRFAHAVRASFDEQPVRDWCLELRWHEFAMSMKAPPDATPRSMFEVDVNTLISYLEGLVGVARIHRLKARDDDAGGPTLLR